MHSTFCKPPGIEKWIAPPQCGQGGRDCGALRGPVERVTGEGLIPLPALPLQVCSVRVLPQSSQVTDAPSASFPSGSITLLAAIPCLQKFFWPGKCSRNREHRHTSLAAAR